MRQPARIACLLRYLVVAVVLCFAARAHADDRADARAHYQAGLKSYGSGDYQTAIREFSAAQQLVPADLNNYNLALCYDKLGDAAPAVQYYRAFLDKQPDTDKRAEIEASISRLEAAQRSAASKKRPKPEAEAPPAGPVLGPPSPPPTAAPPPPPAVAPPPPAGPVLGPPGPPDAEAEAAPPAAAPAKKHHGPAVAAPTGDPQLDRANTISIDDIRAQRGGVGAGMTGPRDHRGPAVAANEPPPSGQPGPDLQGPQGGQGAAPMAPPPGGDEPVKEDPIYKKWWFWGIVAVTGVVVYELATTPSTDNTARVSPPTARATAMPGGLMLLRW
ncbi:MAG TPA: tetratricopeptide repeat protein [Kofleriaceae bacterium]|jgi:hypothetical protein|nr:tetratricopeptide repeat protein [Kofleriaceae bacterium]